MAKEITDECVNCGMPCLGDFCRYKNVVRYYCDECDEEFNNDELYDVDGEMICGNCLISRYRTIEEVERG